LLRAALLRRARAPVRGAQAARFARDDGYEFKELRAATPGDDLRRIDWAATARTGSLQTRVFAEERGLLLACIDASGSMQLGRQCRNYDVACEAARLWFSAAGGDDRCARLSTDGVRLSTVRGRGAVAFCMGPSADAVDLGAGLAAAAYALPRAASLLVISDFFEIDELEEVLRTCAQRHDLTALLVRDPWFAGLPLRGFVCLRDAERGRVVRTFLGAAESKRYRHAVAAREAAVCARLRGLGARSGLLDDDVPSSLLGAFGICA
jgi:uncharacterized protein (DUF58 family)